MAGESFIDSPLSLVIGAAMVVVAVVWLRHYIRHRHGRGRARRFLGITFRILFLLLGVIILADGTNRVGFNICFDLSDGAEWCNHPEASEQSSDAEAAADSPGSARPDNDD